VLFVAKENIALAGLGDTYHDLPIHFMMRSRL